MIRLRLKTKSPIDSLLNQHKGCMSVNYKFCQSKPNEEKTTIPIMEQKAQPMKKNTLAGNYF